MRTILRAGLAELGLDEAKAEPLEAFARAVLEKNRVMNLTAITDEADFARLHLLDSAALLKLTGSAGLDGRAVVQHSVSPVGRPFPLRLGRPHKSKHSYLHHTSRRSKDVGHPGRARQQ